MIIEYKRPKSKFRYIVERDTAKVDYAFNPINGTGWVRDFNNYVSKNLNAIEDIDFTIDCVSLRRGNETPLVFMLNDLELAREFDKRFGKTTEPFESLDYLQKNVNEKKWRIV